MQERRETTADIDIDIDIVINIVIVIYRSCLVVQVRIPLVLYATLRTLVFEIGSQRRMFTVRLQEGRIWVEHADSVLLCRSPFTFIVRKVLS